MRVGIILCDIAIIRADQEHVAGRQQYGGARVDCRYAGRRKRVCFRVVDLGRLHECPPTGGAAYDQYPAVPEKHRLMVYAVKLHFTGFG